MKKVISAIAMSTMLMFGVATVAPTAAEAASCQQVRKNSAKRGTLYGALGGALLGSAVAGRGNKTEGAVLGGAVGAVAGHQVYKKKVNCNNGRYKRVYRNGRYIYIRR